MTLSVRDITYTNQNMTVKWNNAHSTAIHGVKQGGVLSPILLNCIYVDNLFHLLKTKGSGCHIGSHFCGAFGYADDIIVLSSSVSGLQSMLDSCNDFAT